MKLYLVRHAIAEPRGLLPDSERPLTNEGEAKMRRHIRALVRLGEDIDVVITSPLARARETAEILADGIDPRPEVVVEEQLAPDGDAMKLVETIVQRHMGRAVALVGHEPDMSELASRLISGSNEVDLDFKKGTIARIDVDEDDHPTLGQLRWLLSPRQLRAIAKGDGSGCT